MATNNWKLWQWILGAICIPAALPLVACHLWQKYLINNNRKRLAGKVVLITGASSGLGEAMAHAFYKSGCKVILAARRMDEMRRVKNDLLSLEVMGAAYPPTTLYLDLADLKSISKFAEEALSVHNGIDILVNNGGISVRGSAISTALDVDIKIMTVNYFGSIALTKSLLPSMVQRQRGHIVFVSSVQGKYALPNRSAYSASKHAMQAFADSLRAEISSKGLKVTCICPGYVQTQLSMNALTATGQKYNKMDDSTVGGMRADVCAMKIVNALLSEKEELIVCDLQARAAHYIRFLLPSLYHWIMKKRNLKFEKES